MIIRIFCMLACCLGTIAPLSGHQVETVEFEFQKLEKEWRLLGQMDIAYMLPETRMIPGGQPLSRKAVMKSSSEELARIRMETEKTLRSMLTITFADKPIEWRMEFPDFDKQPFALPEEYADWALLTVRIVVPVQAPPGDLTLHWSRSEKAELIVLTADSENGEVVSVQPGGTLTLLSLTDVGRPAVNETNSFQSWLWSGYRHVLPVGFDHMLFILGLFLLALEWRSLMTQSLLFTLAHSITLAISVLGWIHMEGKLVEILIAFSIAFIGIENLFAKRVGPLRYGLVFGFGLIHGLGFANVMAEKVRGVPRSQLVEPLLGFNLGVELAQISVLLGAFLIFLPFLGKRLRVAQITGSVLISLAGITWMIQRIFFR